MSTFNLLKLCNDFNVEYDKDRLRTVLSDYIVVNTRSTIIINEQGKEFFLHNIVCAGADKKN